MTRELDPSGRLVRWFGKWPKPLRTWRRKPAPVPPGDIDELAQEVFVRLLRYGDEAVVDPQAYLFRIAAGVAHEWRGRSRIGRSHDDDWLEDRQFEANAEPENELARRQMQEHVKAAVDRLEPRQREALLLHMDGGLTYKEIARLRGLPYRVVLRDLTRAYSTLRMQL